jgi:hypothetical protein
MRGLLNKHLYALRISAVSEVSHRSKNACPLEEDEFGNKGGDTEESREESRRERV